jgi:hypothetical protein
VGAAAAADQGVELVIEEGYIRDTDEVTLRVDERGQAGSQDGQLATRSELRDPGAVPAFLGIDGRNHLGAGSGRRGRAPDALPQRCRACRLDRM